MKIERVDLIQIKIPIKGHFETSYGRQYDAEKLVLKFYSPDFIVHTDCAAGSVPGFSYETLGTAREILKAYILPAIMGAPLQGPEDFWPRVARFRGHPMAKAAVENALWIMKALEEDMPLARLLGNHQDRVTAGVAIGIQDSAEELLDLVGRYLELGYRKIKMKIKPGADLDRVAAVRRSFPDILLMVDANNAYTLDDQDMIKALDEFNLLLIEQPLAYDDILDHAKLQKELETPIGLDESIPGPYQARVALELQACRAINIKQARVGGLTRAKEIHDLCQAGGVGVWCGGTMETGLGRAVITALSGLPNFTFPNDFSASDRYFARDIVDPEFHLNMDGTISVPQGPGLGVVVNEPVLDGYTVARDVIRI